MFKTDKTMMQTAVSFSERDVGAFLETLSAGIAQLGER